MKTSRYRIFYRVTTVMLHALHIVRAFYHCWIDAHLFTQQNAWVANTKIELPQTWKFYLVKYLQDNLMLLRSLRLLSKLIEKGRA